VLRRQRARAHESGGGTEQQGTGEHQVAEARRCRFILLFMDSPSVSEISRSTRKKRVLTHRTDSTALQADQVPEAR
jgi:hypothetical protein